MKTIAFAATLCTAAAWAQTAPSVSTASAAARTPAPATMKVRLKAGGRARVALPCAPGTGYEWTLRSIDRRVAVVVGKPQFKAARPGLIGGGGECEWTLRGVRPGKTTASFVYRRAWEKAPPAKTAEVDIVGAPRAK